MPNDFHPDLEVVAQPAGAGLEGLPPPRHLFLRRLDRLGRGFLVAQALGDVDRLVLY